MVPACRFNRGSVGDYGHPKKNADPKKILGPTPLSRKRFLDPTLICNWRFALQPCDKRMRCQYPLQGALGGCRNDNQANLMLFREPCCPSASWKPRG